MNRKREFVQSNLSEFTEINLDQELTAEVLRYNRKTFLLNLEKYGRNHVKNKTLEIYVKAITGDPDLYISVAEPPTEKEYLWRSCMDGRDVIKIHPEDPNYRIGVFYIAVSDASTDSTFTICARMVQPARHTDEDTFSRIQQGMYQSIKSGIQVSEHRRRLCAVGKITNLSSALRHINSKEARGKGFYDALPTSRPQTRAQSRTGESDTCSLPMLPEVKKKVQVERR